MWIFFVPWQRTFDNFNCFARFILRKVLKYHFGKMKDGNLAYNIMIHKNGAVKRDKRQPQYNSLLKHVPFVCVIDGSRSTRVSIYINICLYQREKCPVVNIHHSSPLFDSLTDNDAGTYITPVCLTKISTSLLPSSPRHAVWTCSLLRLHTAKIPKLVN
jgi:hypothetical protein